MVLKRGRSSARKQLCCRPDLSIQYQENYKEDILEIPPAFCVWNRHMYILKAYAWPVF